MDFNITLVSILVILFLYIPGFFFKRCYYTGYFTRQFNAGTFAERFITSIFWGLVVQAIALKMIDRFTTVTYESVRTRISIFYAALQKGNMPSCEPVEFNMVLGFFITSIVIGVALGFLTHNFVRLLRLDIFFPVLRFSNDWNYYFRGDLHNLRQDKRRGKVISTAIDILTEDGSDGGKMYSGFLAHYTISHSTGELETIAIIDAGRWSKTNMEFKAIPGDNIVIPYKNVRNINMRYNIESRGRIWKRALYYLLIVLAFVSMPGALFFIPHHFYAKIGLWKVVLSLIIAVVDLLFIYSALFPFIRYLQGKKFDLENPVGFYIAEGIIIGLVSWALYAALT